MVETSKSVTASCACEKLVRGNGGGTGRMREAIRRECVCARVCVCAHAVACEREGERETVCRSRGIYDRENDSLSVCLRERLRGCETEYVCV